MPNSNNTPTFTHLDEWLEEVGFVLERDPFKLVAERDNYLERYFTTFPFFAQIEKPETSFLFLERGIGKSANRIMLANFCKKSLRNDFDRYLSINYVDFSSLMYKDEAKLEDHVDVILGGAVPRLYDLIMQPTWAKSLNDLSAEHKKDFVWFITRYSNRLSSDSIAEQIYRLQGLSEEVKREVTRDVIKVGTDLLSRLAGADQLGNIVFNGLATLLKVNPEDLKDLGKIPPSPLELMKRFAEITQSLKVDHLYILIDKVDELGGIFDYQEVANIISSLIRTVPLLEMPPYAFKFFLPLEIRKKLTTSLRTDRFNIYSYDSSELWTKDQLRALLEKRLDYYCDEQKILDEADRRSFTRLFTPEVRLGNVDIIAEMTDKTGPSPRNFLRLVKNIIDEHTKLPPIELEISKETYQRTLQNFAA